MDEDNRSEAQKRFNNSLLITMVILIVGIIIALLMVKFTDFSGAIPKISIDLLNIK